MMMNVLKKYPYRMRYYVARPWLFVRDTYHNFRWAWQRITRGFCDYDHYDIGEWFFNVAPSMVEELVKNAHGYPATYNSFEDWKRDVLELKDALAAASAEQHNEYEEVVDSCYEKYETPDRELLDNYLRREKEIYESKMAARKKALELFAHLHEVLWD